ncbi:hypothetical protein FRC09_010021 [Ceratobasidium sp. 395]|nr:hypothetical protein FRC09_010021 [Ceratobasidium sp. 395]
MSLPPPYYSTAAGLQAEHRDAATLLRRTSETIVKIDQAFHQVGVLIKGQQSIAVSATSLKDEWQAIRKSFHAIIWGARGAATQVESRNNDFIQVIIPVVGDPDESKDSKIAELRGFVSRKPPTFLTSTEVSQKLQEIEAGLTKTQKQYGEDADRMVASAKANIAKLEEEREKAKKKAEAPPKKSGYGFFGGSKAPTSPPPEPVDYDGKIERAQTIIATVNSQRDQIKSKIAEIKHAWATIPDQVGQCLHAIWDHLTTDASHLKGRLEGSISDPMPDLSAITRVYTEINSALRYYATNVNNMGR